MATADYTTTNGIPIRADGRIVGKVVGDRFCKRVRGSIHRLTTPPGWALDSQSLTDAESHGARVVEIHDTETGITYSAPIGLVRERGFALNRGYGHQVVLALKYWSVGHPGARQLALALEGA